MTRLRRDQVLALPLAELGLSVRTYNSLYGRGGLRSIGDLVSLTANQVLDKEQIGEVGLDDVREQLKGLAKKHHLVLKLKGD